MQMLPFEQLVQNILSTYGMATDAERNAGLRWYEHAHKLAASLAHRYGYTVETACAVFAVISPRVSWDRNVEVATLALSTGHLPPGFILPDNQVKVNRLLAGDPPALVVKGQKVKNFYQNILSSGKNDGATIDVHAAHIALGVILDDKERDLLLKRKVDDQRNGYDYIADAYREAAYRLGLFVSWVQAVAWVVWRELLTGRPRGANALVA
jgi:hypothetical protein